MAQRVQAFGLPDCKGSRLSRLEAGYADAEWGEVEALAKALNVTAQWLAGTNEAATAPVLPAAPEPLPPPPPAVQPAAVAAAAPADLVASAQGNAVHPDLVGLDRSAHRSDYDFRQHLASSLSRARAKLHEAGLPAADWKHWRMVERKALDELRKSANG